MTRTIVAAAAALLLASAPAAAQPGTQPQAQTQAQADVWTHAASGAVFPRRIGEQSIARAEDINGANDSIVDYAGADTRESTTVHIFRAAYPDARLWYDQVLGSIGRRIPLDIFEAGPEQTFAGFGSSIPNTIQRIYTTEQAGPFKSTSIVIAQAGPWLIKMYASSPTLDRAGLAARIAAFAQSIRFPAETRFAAAGGPLPTCRAPQMPGRAVEPDMERLAVALGAGAAVQQRSRQPLPDGGAGWCRIAGEQGEIPIIGLRRVDGSGGWIMLLGDAGQAFTAFTPDELALPAGEATTVVVTTPAFVRVAGVYAGLPDPMATINQVIAVLRGQSGLIDYESGQITLGAPDPAVPAKR